MKNKEDKLKINSLPVVTETEEFDLLFPLLNASYNEIKDLSKKKPDEIISKFKVKTLNKILSKIKELLKNKPTIEFLDLFDEENLPSNSDAALILVQFKTAMLQFKTKNYNIDNSKPDSTLKLFEDYTWED